MKIFSDDQLPVRYLKRYPDDFSISEDIITVSTNHKQVFGSIAWLFFIALPVLPVCLTDVFRSGMGVALCLLAELILIYQTYRFLIGHNRLYIHKKERYVASNNTAFFFQFFFRDRRIALDDIKSIILRNKEERDAEFGDIRTEWTQLIIADKDGKTVIYMDFRKDNRHAVYLKQILEQLSIKKQYNALSEYSGAKYRGDF